MKKLTSRQQDIYEFTCQYIGLNKYPPTFREISEHFGITVRGAYDHIKAIERKGWLRSNRKKSRAIEVIARSDRVNSTCLTNLPLIGNVLAGLPIESEENRQGFIAWPSDMLTAGNFFAWRVTGESMISVGIYHGDIAIIRQQSAVENGDIVVALIEEVITIKRYYKESNRIQLKAENPNVAPIFVHDVRVLGKLSHLIRSY